MNAGVWSVAKSLRERLANSCYPLVTAGSFRVCRSVQLNCFRLGVGKNDMANANRAATVSLLTKYGITPITTETGGYHAWTNWRDYPHEFAQEVFR
jgi:hypothetical protein